MIAGFLLKRVGHGNADVDKTASDLWISQATARASRFDEKAQELAVLRSNFFGMTIQETSRSQIIRDAERARRLLDGVNDRQSISVLRAYADELDHILKSQLSREIRAD